MKRFEFRLERVLEYRQIQSNLVQKELERLQATWQATFNRLADTIRERSESWVSPPPGEEVSPSSLDIAGRYRELLGRTEVRLKSQVAEIDQKIAAQRKIAIEADRNCRLLEKLKTRRREEWRAAFDHELEEIAADAYRSRLHANRALVQEC